MVIGNTKFVRLKMPDVTCRLFGACGGKATEFLGVDLLARRARPSLGTSRPSCDNLTSNRDQSLAAEMHSEMHHCCRLSYFRRSELSLMPGNPKSSLVQHGNCAIRARTVDRILPREIFSIKTGCKVEIRESEFHCHR